MWKFFKGFFWVCTGLFWLLVIIGVAKTCDRAQKVNNEMLQSEEDLSRLTAEYEAEIQKASSQSSVTTMAQSEVVPVKVSSEMPDNILAKVKQEASSMFPGDFSTQRYYINQQKEGYRTVINYTHSKVPEKVLNRIKRDASSMFKHDYSTQAYYINQQVEAYLSL